MTSPRPQSPEPHDPAGRGERAVLLALLEGALDRGEHDRADSLRRRLAELGVTVSLRVGRNTVRPEGGVR